ELLLGWTRDEHRLWLVPGGLMERVDRLGAVALAGAMARCRCGSEVPRGYRTLHPEAGTADLVGRLVTDHLLCVPLHRLADARQEPSYVYEFAWPSRLPGLGACHALELGFVFDTGETPESRRLAGQGAPRQLADVMHTAWVRFARDGDPGWERWDATHPVRVFADPDPDAEDALAYTAHGPRDRELALWARDATTPDTTAPALVDAGQPRGTELRAAVRRIRRAGALRRR
ncbi:carboxylesterase family protein, partial [Streptomyces sp.]|uniref:carboxylesterase family protein n=1 Tax=Streptomyces sp. TaxID=1931 RepID=UPI002811B0CA